MLALATWLRYLIAVALFVVIAWVGLMFLRGIGSSRPKAEIEPEEVAELDVYFVCRECGTELQVTKLGQVQVPRHCGEPMSVVRRPRQRAESN